MKVSSISDIAAKYAKRAAAAGPDYAAGVAAPSKDWATETKNAESAYQAGVQQAISRGAFGKGVGKAGSEKWQKKATTLGAQRYNTGVTAGQADYAAGFQPYAEALNRIALPPRGSRGDPSNIQRVQAVAQALHSQKTGGV